MMADKYFVMLVTTNIITKDYTNATPSEILQDVALPTVIYTGQCVVHSNEVVNFFVPLDSFDYSVDLIFDDGNGNITTVLGQFNNTTLTASYPTEGVFSPVLSTRKYTNPSIVSRSEFGNFIVVRDTNVDYDTDSDRKIFTSLELPHNRESLCIKPSEFVKDTTFNVVVDKYFENFDYLVKQTLLYSQDLPYVWHGWFDLNGWHVGLPETTVSSISATEIEFYDDKLLTIENNGLKLREDDYYLTLVAELSSVTEAETFIKPESISIWGYKILVVDSGKNSFFVFHIDNNVLVNDVYLGGFGLPTDNYRFNNPTDGHISTHGVLIVDTDNKCVKQFTKTYHWSYTYTGFGSAKPIKVTRNADRVFVLCDNNKIYIFEQNTDSPIKIIDDIAEPQTILLDDYNTDLLYVFGKTAVYLYDREFRLIAYNKNFPSTRAVAQKDKKYYTVGNEGYIGKFTDYLSYTNIGSDISSNIWGIDSVYVNWQEYDQHLIYNDSFAKMRDNLKIFANSITAVPVNYYDFDGEFIYQDFESTTLSTCDFQNYFIGVNEIESYDILRREWNRIWDLMECIKDGIDTKRKHPAIDSNNCLTWVSGKSTFNINSNTVSWPISWEELECDESTIDGTIRGILPQHWTWNWLRSERKNAPTWVELECNVVDDFAVKTWEEMEYNVGYATQYTWEETLKFATLSTQYYNLTCTDIWGGITWNSLCGDPVENPYSTWKNLDCCETTYNVVPYDFANNTETSNIYSWNSLSCAVSAGPFTPLDIPGLVLWLDPSDITTLN